MLTSRQSLVSLLLEEIMFLELLINHQYKKNWSVSPRIREHAFIHQTGSNSSNLDIIMCEHKAVDNIREVDGL